MKLLLTTLLFIVSINSFSKDEKKWNDKYKVNFGSGLNYNDYQTMSLSLGFYVKNGFCIDLYRSTSGVVSKNLPNDYLRSYTTLFGITRKHGLPFDYMNRKGIMIGKGISTRNSLGNILFKVGVSKNNYTVAHNFEANPKFNHYNGESNYVHSNKAISNYEFIAEIEGQLAFSKALGFSIAPNININSSEKHFGVRFKLIVGKIQ